MRGEGNKTVLMNRSENKRQYVFAVDILYYSNDLSGESCKNSLLYVDNTRSFVSEAIIIVIISTDTFARPLPSNRNYAQGGLSSFRQSMPK